jgi:hypothetical protein
VRGRTLAPLSKIARRNRWSSRHMAAMRSRCAPQARVVDALQCTLMSSTSFRFSNLQPIKAILYLYFLPPIRSLYHDRMNAPPHPPTGLLTRCVPSDRFIFLFFSLQRLLAAALDTIQDQHAIPTCRTSSPCPCLTAARASLAAIGRICRACLCRSARA